MSIKLKGLIEEYTGSLPLNETTILRINQELTDMLTRQARDVVRSLQKANCDIFGVGRELIAYHNRLWKQKDWAKDYPDVQFHTNVQVSIINTGIIQ